MRLYHYTSLDSFLKIWQTKRLLFSTSHKITINDFFEKRKIFTITGEILSASNADWNAFSNKLNTYKQISLTKDYKPGLGCLSPMMWGQYADNGNGVCIEIESEDLDIKKKEIWPNEVKYEPSYPEIKIEAEVLKNHLKHDDFISDNRDKIFFVKHKHWTYENEYRLISNCRDYLDISKALIKVHVPNVNGHTSYVVRKIVCDDAIVNYIQAIPKDGYIKYYTIPFKGPVIDLNLQ